MFCKKDTCSTAICEDCWSSNHNGHLVIPLQNEINKLLENTNTKWESITQCQNEHQRLVAESMTLQDNIMSATNAMDALESTKKMLQKPQNIDDVLVFTQNTLRELEEQTERIKIVDRSISSLASSCKEIAKCLESAKLTFSKNEIPDSLRVRIGASRNPKKWKLKDIRKGRAVDCDLYTHPQYCGITQRLFFPGNNGIHIFKIQDDRIQWDRNLILSGNSQGQIVRKS